MSPIAITLTLLVCVIILFVTEKLPLAVTSMLALMVLVLTGVLSPKDAFAGFVDNNLILFVAMFIIGGAFFETGMANKVGGIVTRFASSERQLIVAVMLVTGIMSGFLSNTGTAAILIPVVIGIASKSGFARSRLLLPLIFAAAMGGNLSIIGAPGNLLGKSALEAIGQDISFFEYGFVGFPILLIGTAFFATVGYRFLPERQGKTGESIYDKTPDFSQVPAWKQKVSLIVMVLTIIAMIFEKQIGIKFYLSGCIGALVLVTLGVISEKQAYQSIDLQTLFVYGGTLALAKALAKTGAGKAVADGVIGLLGSNASPLLLLAVILLLSCVMTNFMSNFGTAGGPADPHFREYFRSHGGGPQGGDRSHGHRRFPGFCHPHWHACQHDGVRPRGIHLQRLREGRHSHGDHRLHRLSHPAAHPVPFLSLMESEPVHKKFLCVQV